MIGSVYQAGFVTGALSAALFTTGLWISANQARRDRETRRRRAPIDGLQRIHDRGGDR